jgi:hypothetical protein
MNLYEGYRSSSSALPAMHSRRCLASPEGFEVEHPVVSVLQLNYQQMSLSPTGHVLDVYCSGTGRAKPGCSTTGTPTDWMRAMNPPQYRGMNNTTAKQHRHAGAKRAPGPAKPT